VTDGTAYLLVDEAPLLKEELKREAMVVLYLAVSIVVI
jgi:hypothetical protein